MRYILLLVLLISNSKVFSQVHQFVEEKKLFSNCSFEVVENHYQHKDIVFSNDEEIIKSFFYLHSSDMDDFFIWEKNQFKNGYTETHAKYIDVKDQNLSKPQFSSKFYNVKFDIFYLFGKQFLVLNKDDNFYFLYLKWHLCDSKKFIMIFERHN